MMTITMSVEEYEQMKKKMQELKDESLFNYVSKEYSNLIKNEYGYKIDVTAIKERIKDKEDRLVELV